MRKDMLVIGEVAFASLLVAVLLYPLLHECGHALASILLGVDVLEFNLRPPLASVVCDMTNASNLDIIIIGLSGNLLSTLVVIILYLINIENFCLWFMRLYLCIVCILSYGLSIVNLLIHDISDNTDDIFRVASMYPKTKVLCVVMCIVLLGVTIFLVVKSKILSHFDSRLKK